MIKFYKLFFLVVSFNLFSYETQDLIENNPSDSSKVPQEYVECYNYESNDSVQYDDLGRKYTLLYEKEVNFNKIMQDLHIEDISNMFLDDELVKLIVYNCPRKLRWLIGDYAKQFFTKQNNLPTKILLTGPSGTGKSTLAHIIAQKTNRRAYFIRGSAFSNEFQHSGIQNLSKLFEALFELEVPVVLVIDELTALTNRYNERKLDPGMVEEFWMLLDKCEKKGNVLVVATANDIDQVPQQIKTRFAGHLYTIENASFTLRKELIKYYFKNFDTLNFWQQYWFLYQTKSLSMRELKDIIENAKFYSVHRNDIRIKHEDLSGALSDYKAAQQKLTVSLQNEMKFHLPWIIPTAIATILSIYQIYLHQQSLSIKKTA
ncbi:MAG: ATP-binding protein [Candidatus Babeliales bacterium]